MTHSCCWHQGNLALDTRKGTRENDDHASGAAGLHWRDQRPRLLTCCTAGDVLNAMNSKRSKTIAEAVDRLVMKVPHFSTAVYSRRRIEIEGRPLMTASEDDAN